MQVIERPQWGQWVTPKLLRQRPIYRWYVYPHSYDKELVLALLREMQVQENEWVWDPFVGAGTTLLACKEYGCSGIGTDLLPLSVLATTAKIKTYDPTKLSRAMEMLRFSLPSGAIDRFAPVPIVKKALTADLRRQISNLLDQIDALPRASRSFFQLALLRAMEDLGLAVKSGGWLRIDSDRAVKGKSLRTQFRHHAKTMIADIESSDCSQNNGGEYKVWKADARTVKAGKLISACITSPPYLNRHDYTRVFALELALMAVTSTSALIDLRRRTLRSHVEARPLSRTQRKSPNLPVQVTQVVEAVEAAGVNDPRVPSMIKGYFEDMLIVLENIARNLRQGGHAALVVGNTRFSGVMIPVDDILIAMGPTAGLEPKQIIVARRRGNSAQQMGVYGREPSRESVLIFEKPR